MKKYLLMILFALSTICFAEAQSAKKLPAESLQRFDSYLSEIKKAYHIPGMAFFITTPEETVFERT